MKVKDQKALLDKEILKILAEFPTEHTWRYSELLLLLNKALKSKFVTTKSMAIQAYKRAEKDLTAH